MTKTCSKCNTEKGLDSFHKKKGNKDGYRFTCKVCRKVETRKYYVNNKEKITEANKAWKSSNKEEYAKYKKQWYEENKADISARSKYLYNKNREQIREDRRIKYHANLDEILIKRAEYYKANKSDILKRQTTRHKQRIKTDAGYKLAHNLRCRTRLALMGQNKASTTESLLGCTFEHARYHLESQFTDGMSWDNWSMHGWHVDHIIPCASFDLTDPEQQRQCFHYTNLQPLWARDNLRKSDKLPHEL